MGLRVAQWSSLWRGFIFLSNLSKYLCFKKKDDASSDSYHPVVRRNPQKPFEKLRENVKIYVQMHVASTIREMNLNLVSAILSIRSAGSSLLSPIPIPMKTVSSLYRRWFRNIKIINKFIFMMRCSYALARQGKCIYWRSRIGAIYQSKDRKKYKAFLGNLNDLSK